MALKDSWSLCCPLPNNPSSSHITSEFPSPHPSLLFTYYLYTVTTETEQAPWPKQFLSQPGGTVIIYFYYYYFILFFCFSLTYCRCGNSSFLNFTDLLTTLPLFLLCWGVTWAPFDLLFVQQIWRSYNECKTKVSQWEKKKQKRMREHELNKKKNKTGQLTPAEAVSVLASSQATGGRVCYSFVAVICFGEVQSKLVQTAQPGSASWVNMQLRRGLLTTHFSLACTPICFMLKGRPFHTLQAE